MTKPPSPPYNNNMNETTQLGRAETLDATPKPLDNALPDFDPSTPVPYLKIEDSEDLLEDLIVRVYSRVLGDPNEKAEVTLKAAKDASVLIGKVGQSKITVVKAENAQINQLNTNPELLEHFKRAASGLADLTGATEADIIVSRGGQGA